MQPYQISGDEVLRNCNGNKETGLTLAQVEENRQKYGENKIEKAQPPSLVKRIFDALKEPMMIILLVAALITFAVNVAKMLSGAPTDFIECVGILVAIALSVAITVVMEGKSQKSFEALNKMQENIMVRVLRDGEVLLLPQSELVVGDIVDLETGDKIPADCRLLSSIGLSVDESALTGESNAVKKDASLIYDKEVPLAERKNMVYSGCFITMGSCMAVVCYVGNKTELGKIAKELADAQQPATPLQQKLAKLGKNITVLGVTASVLVFLIQLVKLFLQGGANLTSIGEILITSIVLIVAAVPEGLPTIVAMSLALNVIKMAKENALVKKMVACETIGSVNIICSDKTGTLTQNRMTVTAYYDGKWHTDPKTLLSEDIAHNICLNTTAAINYQGGVPEYIGNPTECALLAAYQNSDIQTKTGKSYNEERGDHSSLYIFPFSSDLKHMTTVSNVDGDVISYIKGSPELIMSFCTISPQEEKEINQLIETAQDKAMRVIAFAHKHVAKEIDYTDEKEHAKMESEMHFDGFVAIEDPIRPEVFEAVKTCNKAGISLKILTGDNIHTAKAIAGQLGILKDDSIAITAAEIEAMSDEELEKCLPSVAVIARSTPSLKLRVVKTLMRLGNAVAVTGDGVNDAPAIKYADVGVAMGVAGTEVAKEAADIVLLDDSFATIAKAVRWGRGIYKNFQRFITFQLTVNLASVLTVIVSILTGFASPFNALQLLWINIIMDGPPALTLGLEPLRTDLMKEKPIPRDANIITSAMLTKIIVNGVWISLIFMLQTYTNFLGATPVEQSTVLFTMFVLFQLMNAFNCRELGIGSVLPNLLNNRLMLGVFAGTFALQVIITQFGGAVFSTVPLGFVMWIKLVLVSLSVILAAEIAKLVERKLFKRK